MLWDDLNMENVSYRSHKAYGMSKLANILHAMELARRLKHSGILAFSLHPGLNQFMTIFDVLIYVIFSHLRICRDRDISEVWRWLGQWMLWKIDDFQCGINTSTGCSDNSGMDFVINI